MFLFSRISTVAPGKYGAAQPFIAEITQHVNEQTPFDVSVWGFLFGRPVGTIGWSMMFDDLGAYLDASAELNAAEAYVAKVASGADLFVGPAVDSLREVVHVAGEIPDQSAYVASTVAVINDDYSDALTWSVGMTDLAQSTTGTATMLLRDVYGPFGGVQWLSGYPDSAAVASAAAAIRDSDEYIARLDAAEDLFVPASGEQALLRHML